MMALKTENTVLNKTVLALNTTKCEYDVNFVLQIKICLLKISSNTHQNDYYYSLFFFQYASRSGLCSVRLPKIFLFQKYRRQYWYDPFSERKISGVGMKYSRTHIT